MTLIPGKEATRLLGGISRMTFWRIDQEENFSKFAIRGRTQYDREEILEYIESKRISGVSRADTGASCQDDAEVAPLVFK